MDAMDVNEESKSSFYMDIESLIPESAVDLHINLKTKMGYYIVFAKCSGRFVCPIYEEENKIEPYDLAIKLDNVFYNFRMKYYWKDE